MTLRDYYGQVYGNKMDNLEEMDRFLEKFNLPSLNQEETEIMNNPIISRASLVVQRLKHLPPMRETWVRSLGWEDPLEKEMATHSSILA